MMRLIKTNILTNHFKDSAYLIDLLENFVVERGVYGKRLMKNCLVLITLRKWDVKNIN